MLRLKAFFDLIRIKQVLFKNSVIFVSLIFSIGSFSTALFLKDLVFVILGFVSLCLASSSSYIINDLNDVERDKTHPEKRKRPLASGKVQKKVALVISIMLLSSSLILAAILSTLSSSIFIFFIFALFLFSQLYNFVFREIVFLDIIIISINFVIRAVSGTFLIDERISYWLVLSIFFLSVFLVGTKRFTEEETMDIKTYRKGYKNLNKKLMLTIIALSAFAVFVFFFIYTITSKNLWLLMSMPISIYLVWLFFDKVRKNPKEIRNPENFIFSPRVAVLLFAWLLLIILALVM